MQRRLALKTRDGSNLGHDQRNAIQNTGSAFDDFQVMPLGINLKKYALGGKTLFTPKFVQPIGGNRNLVCDLKGLGALKLGLGFLQAASVILIADVKF